MNKGTSLGSFRFLPLLMPFVLVLAVGNIVLAAEYPDRAITLIAPYAPGGVTDLALARWQRPWRNT